MLKTNACLLFLLFCLALITTDASARAEQQPNVVLVFIDDMGWGDFSCFGNPDASTPHIDAMAAEGIQFHHFYVNSPICSPSRVAISTGQYPQRWRVSSYLAARSANKKRGIANWLDPKAPMLARHLKKAGYATGHFGKWHMGGQRDVADAPKIAEYGFDESLTNFEGMDDKLLPLTEEPLEGGGIQKGKMWDRAEQLGAPFEWKLRCEITGGFVERAVAFIDNAQQQDKPFYINLWPDDVHTKHFPSVKNWRDTPRGLYCAVLEEMDAQLQPLFSRIKQDPTLCKNTIVLICSDNGPEAGCGSAGPLKGLKATLYEGGIRSPLVVWAPGLMNKQVLGTINETSIMCAMDLVPSVLALANVVPPKGVMFDGVDLSQTLLGASQASRGAPLFFRRPPDRKDFRSMKNLPDFAMRDGKWKLMCDYDGGRPMLFDLDSDESESVNLASKHLDRVQRMTEAVMAWNSQLPKDAGDPQFQ
ncbi:MAG TPA: N-acetylgalactosamine-6-sulfatase [Planctomycetaceae bacterium]|nr:N-acetylgalactosamine-6-sulfatase [Planctomycetaceae bacterium]